MTERETWLAISAFVPIGPTRFGSLIRHYRTAEAIWKATRSDLQNFGLTDNLVNKFNVYRKSFDITNFKVKLKKLSIEYVTLFDKNYPQNLKEIESPPFVLYFKGDIRICNKLSIAIVGSRKITEYGKFVAEKFSKELSSRGIVIISGLARGVDTAAHKSTLQVKGKTISVLGCGLNIIYPPENFGLADEIVEKDGVLISEYPLDYPVFPSNFNARNRIISGLSHGVLVVEGAENSGTLLTAKHAAYQGREVFAVPGQINSPNSWVPHFLIKQGAKITTEVSDIMESLGIEAMMGSDYSK